MIIKKYFGQASASDFTHHKNEQRKQRYINRHKFITKQMKIGPNVKRYRRVLVSLVVMESSNHKGQLHGYKTAFQHRV